MKQKDSFQQQQHNQRQQQQQQEEHPLMGQQIDDN